MSRRKDETWWANMSPEAREQIAEIFRRVIKKGKAMEKRGIIRSVAGTGGILRITLEDPETGKRTTLSADNGPTVRAFIGLFGTEIVQGHTLLVNRIEGCEIGYDVDDIGLLSYITE